MTDASGFGFQLRRIYEPVTESDGYRVLVDRLWPRGISKASAAVNEWARDVAPSTDLRRWYGHDPAKFEEFAERYRDELRQRSAVTVLAGLRGRAQQTAVTLLTATRDIPHSGAQVLLAVLREEA
jgi:uncharacterized protein YeaO (DUF488 family)